MSVEAGERLRSARLEKGLSEADVAAILKVPVRYIEALDSGDLSGLPEPAFVRGYARGYARIVGIDADAVCALLMPVEIKAPRPQIGIAGMPVTESRRPAARGGRGPGRIARHHRVAGFLLLVVGIAVATWTAYEPEQGAPIGAVPVAPSPAVEGDAGGAINVPLPGVAAADAGAASRPLPLPAAGAEPGQLPASPAAQPADAGAEPAASVAEDIPREGLFVRFRGDCWIEVRDADNIVIHHSTGVAGRDLRLAGKEPLVVTLGNAGRVDLWWNGEPVKVDAFSRAGVARVNLGRLTR